MASCACFSTGVPGPRGPQGDIGPTGAQGPPGNDANITGTDTNCIHTTVTGSPTTGFNVTVDAVVDTTSACNGLKCTANGLAVIPSTDANNALSCGTDGNLFINTTAVNVDSDSTDCIDLQITGSGSAIDPFTITAHPIIATGCNGLTCTAAGLAVRPSTDSGNTIVCGSDGNLFVPAAAALTVTDTPSVDLTLGASLSADVKVSAAADNQVSINPDGLFVPDCSTPIGGIILWFGNPGTVPSNWQICDGTNGTPDMTDAVPIGVGANALGSLVGSTTATLTNNELPNHTHTDAGHSHGHSHGITVDANNFNTSTESNLHDHNEGGAGDHAHNPNGAGGADWGIRFGAATNGLVRPYAEGVTFTSMANAGNHAHPIFGNNQLHTHNANHGHTGSASFDATNGVANIQPAGNGQPFSIVQPSRALYFIMKMSAC